MEVNKRENLKQYCLNFVYYSTVLIVLFKANPTKEELEVFFDTLYKQFFVKIEQFSLKSFFENSVTFDYFDLEIKNEKVEFKEVLNFSFYYDKHIIRKMMENIDEYYYIVQDSNKSYDDGYTEAYSLVSKISRIEKSNQFQSKTIIQCVKADEEESFSWIKFWNIDELLKKHLEDYRFIEGDKENKLNMLFYRNKIELINILDKINFIQDIVNLLN